MEAYSCRHSHLYIHHFSCHSQHSVNIPHTFPYSSAHMCYMDRLKSKKNRNYSCNIIMEVLGVRKYNSPLLQKSIYYCNWLHHFQQHPLFSEYQRIPHKGQLMVFGSSCWSNQRIKYFWQTAASCSRAPRLCSQKINNLMSWVVIVQDSNEQYGSESEESEQDTSSDVCLSVSSVIDTYVSFAPIYS